MFLISGSETAERTLRRSEEGKKIRTIFTRLYDSKVEGINVGKM